MKTTSPQCPKCGICDSRVVQTCRLFDGSQVRRRRCAGCDNLWYTNQPAERPVSRQQLLWADGAVTGLCRPRKERAS